MRILFRLVWAFVFFSLFAFSLNNQQTVTLNWFFGYAWNAPLVLVVLVTFTVGIAIGVLAMAPSWWRQRRLARQTRAVPAPEAAAPASAPVIAPPSPNDATDARAHGI